MTQNIPLEVNQTDFLDDLIGVIVGRDYIDQHSYDFYKTQVERWQEQGYYHDAMLYFWYYEPIEGLYCKPQDNFDNFVKVVNGLGFLLPSDRQALIINTLNHINRLNIAETTLNRTRAILDFWLAIEDWGTFDTERFDCAFSIMDRKGLIIQDNYWQNFDEQKFNSDYQKLLNMTVYWRKRYSKTKLEHYQELIIV